MIQLNPPIPVDTPKGPGLAHFIVDYGIEHHIYWVCFIDATGECWTYPNPKIRAQKNITLGRTHISPFYNPDSVVNAFYCEDCHDPERGVQLMDGRYLCKNCLGHLIDGEEPEK